MRLRFFTIPVYDPEAAHAELDRFLATHRVVTVDRQLIDDGPRSAWAICVTLHDSSAADHASTTGAAVKSKTSRKTIDYREILSEDDFRVFATLRVLRKEISTRDEVPAYAVFTNEHLAAMVTQHARSLADLAKIPGVGQARLDKYGETFLAALARAQATATPKASTPEDPDAS